MEKVAVIDLSNTSSAVLINPETETIYVYDATVKIQTATTSAITYQAGTSTSIGIDQDTISTTDGNSYGAASILFTGTTAVPTLGFVFFKADYEATDTRDASGTRYVIPVLTTEYLLCAASTTPAANGKTGGQAVQCQFKYFLIKD